VESGERKKYWKELAVQKMIEEMVGISNIFALLSFIIDCAEAARKPDI